MQTMISLQSCLLFLHKKILLNNFYPQFLEKNYKQFAFVGIGNRGFSSKIMKH